MGAHPYWYFEKFDGDVDASLEALREREFQAGRYNPVTPFLKFPIGPDSPAPGAQHSSFDEIMMDAAEEGTRSILDIHQVSESPEFCAACPMSDEVLLNLYGTIQPTRRMVESKMDFLEDVERGQCVYILLYQDGRPNEVFFVGYSFD